jgi:hypothetical protein
MIGRDTEWLFTVRGIIPVHGIEISIKPVIVDPVYVKRKMFKKIPATA